MKNLNIQIFDDKDNILCEDNFIDEFSFKCELTKAKIVIYGIEDGSKSILVDQLLENTKTK